MEAVLQKYRSQINRFAERDNRCHKALNGLKGSSKINIKSFWGNSSMRATGGLSEGQLAQWQQG